VGVEVKTTQQTPLLVCTNLLIKLSGGDEQARHEYERDGRWRFVVNEGDTVKGTGTIDIMEKQ
jgi:hypothetical protein